MTPNLKIRTYTEAQRTLRKNLSDLQSRHYKEFTDGVNVSLVRYVFGNTEHDCFWSLVCWFKTLEPHDSTWHTDYVARGGEKPAVRRRTVESALDRFEKSINSFCEEGPLLNDALDMLEASYRERLKARDAGFSLPPSCNLITELRDAIKDNREGILNMIQRGRPETWDYLLDYLLTVSQRIFPSTPPTGNLSNTFCLFAQAVFSACFFYEESNRPVSVYGLKSRVEKCLQSERKRFKYIVTSDSFIATEEMKIETTR